VPISYVTLVGPLGANARVISDSFLLLVLDELIPFDFEALTQDPGANGFGTAVEDLCGRALLILKRTLLQDQLNL